jgi:hypothetical protein
LEHWDIELEHVLAASLTKLLDGNKLEESVETRVRITLEVYRWETTFMDPILGRIKMIARRCPR